MGAVPCAMVAASPASSPPPAPPPAPAGPLRPVVPGFLLLGGHQQPRWPSERRSPRGWSCISAAPPPAPPPAPPRGEHEPRSGRGRSFHLLHLLLQPTSPVPWTRFSHCLHAVRAPQSRARCPPEAPAVCRCLSVGVCPSAWPHSLTQSLTHCCCCCCWWCWWWWRWVRIAGEAELRV